MSHLVPGVGPPGDRVTGVTPSLAVATLGDSRGKDRRVSQPDGSGAARRATQRARDRRRAGYREPAHRLFHDNSYKSLKLHWPICRASKRLFQQHHRLQDVLLHHHGIVHKLDLPSRNGHELYCRTMMFRLRDKRRRYL